MHTLNHTRVHASHNARLDIYMHRCIPTCKHTCKPTHTCLHTHGRKHSQTHTHTHARARIHTYVCMPARMRVQMHAYKRARHTRLHIYTHAIHSGITPHTGTNANIQYIHAMHALHTSHRIHKKMHINTCKTPSIKCIRTRMHRHNH